MFVQLRKFTGLALPFILFAMVAASAVFGSAQQAEIPGIPNNIPRYNPSAKTSPTPPTTNTPAKPVFFPTPKPIINTGPGKYKDKYKDSKIKKPVLNESDTPAEKSIEVDAKVNISLCVSEGKITVNGWDRNEIRAYVGGGSQVGFKVREKNRQTNSPVWLMVVGFDPLKNQEANADECLSGDEIELDVPRNATVNIKGRESQTMIQSVRKVRVENVSGDIFLNDIASGIDAVTTEGSVTVGKSSGSMVLQSTLGNIVAYEVSPSEIGDPFKAKTIHGMIALDKIEHRQMEINTNSGSIKFAGEFLSGGRYNFVTQSGSVLLSIPEKSSCKITAYFGSGEFYSQIPLINEKRNKQGGTQNLTAQIGKGEATLILTTYDGSLYIKK